MVAEVMLRDRRAPVVSYGSIEVETASWVSIVRWGEDYGK